MKERERYQYGVTGTAILGHWEEKKASLKDKEEKADGEEEEVITTLEARGKVACQKRARREASSGFSCTYALRKRESPISSNSHLARLPSHLVAVELTWPR